MSNEWPPKIEIVFLYNKAPVSSLLVHLAIVSGKKNDFPLEPLLSDKSGKVEVDRNRAENAISNVKKEYPMDYVGSLSDCDGLKIIIDDEKSLNSRLHKLREFYPEEAERLEKLMAICVNRKYVSVIDEIKAPFPLTVVTIQLERKKQ